MKTIKEVLEFDFFQESENKNVGSVIKIHIAIDYKNNKISLVEPELGEFVKKEYVFSNRGVEFMNGWLNILESMQSAIREAKKKMEKYKEDEQKKKDEDVTEILLQATKLVRKNEKHSPRKRV